MAFILLISLFMPFIFILVLFFCGNAMAREPSVQEVQEEAIRYLGFNQREMDDWRKKVRVSAALPTFQVGFARNLSDVVALTTKDSVSVSGGDVFVGPAQSNFDQNFNQGLRFDVRAIWRLNELAFNRDSLLVSQERRHWVEERNRILEKVGKAYHTRRRLLKELKRIGNPLLKDRKKLLMDQMTGEIDAYTGGWFSGEVSS